MESEISNEGLEYLIHHVVFPPKVPQRRDETADGEAALITSMLVQVEAFQALCPASDSQPWSRMRRTFARCQAIHKNLRLIDVKLTESFQNLQPHGKLTQMYCKSRRKFALIDFLYRRPCFTHTCTKRRASGTYDRYRRSHI